jgi:hypothetical protein
VSEDLSRDPLVQKLSRFTPASSTVDRDAMLFAAGKASRSGAGKWKVVASVLALTQTALLVLWFAGPRLDSSQMESRSTVADQPTEHPILRVSSDNQAPSAESYGSLMRHLDRDGLPMPELVADTMPAQPVLSADLRTLEASLK